MLFALSPASLGLQPSNLIAVCKDTVYFITAEKSSQTKITGREGKKNPFLISIFIHILTVKYPSTSTFKTPSSHLRQWIKSKKKVHIVGLEVSKGKIIATTTTKNTQTKQTNDGMNKGIWGQSCQRWYFQEIFNILEEGQELEIEKES